MLKPLVEFLTLDGGTVRVRSGCTVGSCYIMGILGSVISGLSAGVCVCVFACMLGYTGAVVQSFIPYLGGFKF